MSPRRANVQRNQIFSIRPHRLVNAEGLLGDLSICCLSPIKGGPEEGEALAAVVPVAEEGGREGMRKGMSTTSF